MLHISFKYNTKTWNIVIQDWSMSAQMYLWFQLWMKKQKGSHAVCVYEVVDNNWPNIDKNFKPIDVCWKIHNTRTHHFNLQFHIQVHFHNDQPLS
jgi:hypothetical protein